MTAFLQAYGIWIALGLVLLFIVFRIGQSSGSQRHQAQDLNKTHEEHQTGGRHGCC